MKMNKYFLYLVKTTIAGILVFYLLDRNYLDLVAINKIVFSLDFVALVMLVVGSYALIAERQRYLLSLNGYPIEYTSCLKVVLMGIFFNSLLPGGIGSEITKGVYLSKNQPGKISETAISIVLDKYIALYSMSLFAFASVNLGGFILQNSLNKDLISNSISLLFLGVNLPLFFFSSSSISNLIEYRILSNSKLLLKSYTSLKHTLNQKTKLIYPLILSFSGHTLIVLFYKFLLFKQGASIDLGTLFFICSVGAILTSIPITPASIGVGQAIYIFLFDLSGFKDPATAATVVTINQLVTLLVAFSGAYFFIFSHKITKAT